MTQATKKEILRHVNYMSVLMSKIEESALDLDSEACQDRASGTIKNLPPELAKVSSKLKQMLCWGYND